jgi:hypothetical protein
MTTTPTPTSTPAAAEAAPLAPAAVSAAPARTLSILSLVAAIASIPLGHVFILPIAAIIVGFLGHAREPWARTLSTWGIVLGFVILFWWVAAGALAAAFWLPVAIAHHVF